MVEGRRRFFTAIVGSALASAMPRAGHGATRVKRVAVLTNYLDAPESAAEQAEYAKRFEPYGFRVGENLEIKFFEYPLKSEWNTVVPQLVGRIVQWRPDCVSTGGITNTRYLQEATRSIPIVVYIPEASPVDLGFARSLAHPGANITGVHGGAAEVNLKRLELLKALSPGLKCVGWIAFAPQLAWFPTFEKAANALGLLVHKVILEPDDSPKVLEQLRQRLAQLPAQGCRAAHLHTGVPRFIEFVGRESIERRIRLSHGGRSDVFSKYEGLLLSYEPNVSPGFSEGRTVALIARVLRGEQPANIAFEGPAAFHLRLNLKTARRIGVTVPNEVLVLANEVIQ